jgi:nitrite reductase/ring-hydroxylating ferredoxin subunit
MFAAYGVSQERWAGSRTAAINASQHLAMAFVRMLHLTTISVNISFPAGDIIMAIADDYMTLTRVGQGTPMGNLLRRYWIPAVMSEQLPERGGAPVRTRLLGENLVAFRDPQGKLGLVGEFCPHRGASLAYALNEDGGLRCLYHGWKISPAGSILDTPAEPPESTFAKKLCHINYPVHEAGGIVWTYMGPREKEPAFPRFPWIDLPK